MSGRKVDPIGQRALGRPREIKNGVAAVVEKSSVMAIPRDEIASHVPILGSSR
jgi:hypothetical protein